MKAQILKIAGVKNEKEFYKKFPSEEAFMKKHGKELKKAAGGAAIKATKLPTMQGLTASEKALPTLESPINYSNYERTGPDYGYGFSDLASQLSPLTGSLIGNVEDISQSAKDINKLKAYGNIYDVVGKNIKKPEIIKPKYDYTAQRSQTVNPMGVGTNYLQAEDGAEIQNTFAPNTIYTDSGYEPLNDSNVKQFGIGGSLDLFAGSIGGITGNLGSAMGKGTGRGGNWSKIGSTLGGIGGSFLGPGGEFLGEAAGGLIGGLIDSGTQNDIQAAQDKMIAGLNKATGQSAGQAIQSNYSANLKDGGWVSNDWMPQVITKFGDYNMNELLAPPKDADMLRAGGHLREYTPPSARAMYTGRMDDGGTLPSTNMMFDTDRYPSAKYGTSMAMGGDLKTTWGGKAEPMSYNPYLPATGETVMFKGQSHDETNGNGQSGIGVKYGSGGMTDYAEYGTSSAPADVEVERNEPATVLKDPETGDDNLVVYGNMIIPHYGAEELGDKKAKGKKFKNYVADLSKVEAKQNKLIDKSTKLINDLDVATSYDKLSLQAAQANIMGANAKLKDIADKKMAAAHVQNAILDTAQEYGLVSDELAKGKIVKDKEAMKKAKFGAKMETAQKGSALKFMPSNIVAGDMNYPQERIDARMMIAPDAYSPISVSNGIKGMPPFTPYDGTFVQDKNIPTNKEKVYSQFDWNDPIIALQAAAPFYKDTAQQPLDPTQLLPENLALAMNTLEPVQAQFYNPMLQAQPYRVSLQDQRNEVTAQTQAAFKQSTGNPAVAAMIAANASKLMTDIDAQEQRLNQAETMRAAETNRGLMNEAQLKNLAIGDQQYARQAEGKSKTKAQAIEVAKSVADKILKNKLENKKQAILENMYPAYSFTKSGVAYKDPRYLAGFNKYGSSSSQSESYIPEGYEADSYMKTPTGKFVPKTLKLKSNKTKSSSKDDDTEYGRNGAIVKAIKGL